MIGLSVAKSELESAIFRARPFAALHRQDGRKSTDLLGTDSITISYLHYIYIDHKKCDKGRNPI